MVDASFFQTIADAAPIGIVYVDAEERYIFFNRYYVETMGRPVVYGKKIRDVLDEAQYERVKPYLDLAYRGESVSFDSKYNNRDGKCEYMSAAFIPDFDSEGKVRGFVGIAKDITDRVETEVALRKSQDALFFAL